MKISVKVTEPSQQKKTCTIIGIYENHSLTPAAKIIDKISNGQIKNLLKKDIFSGKIGQTLPLFHVGPEAVLLVGCGKKQAISAGNFRKIIGTAITALNAIRLTQASCFLTELEVDKKDIAWKVKHIAETASETLYRFEDFKTEKQDPIVLNEFIIPITEEDPKKPCELALKQGLAIAEGVKFTKNLANLPSNICTPGYLAEQAKHLAKKYSTIAVQILEEKDMAKLGMGAFLGVTKGSSENAKLITLEYNGTAKKIAPIVLVGKGITFDTGGISLKPQDSIVGMKYDMCGAATVLGTLKAAAELKLPIKIVGVIAASENMPDGAAYKPEDILTSMSGQTIEVISTDAEGRLVLCDALTYSERYKPEVVIDIATLTGAVVVALGNHATGMLTNHDPLAKDLIKAGEESFDRVWQLPLWDEYQEQIKSPFADMANVGSRGAGTITAGCFLSRFTKSFHWAHLDVAGTAAIMAGVSERKATGRPVPLLMQYLIHQAQK